MPQDIFGTNELRGLIDLQYKPTTFLTNYFFPEVQLFDTERITFDKLRGVRKLAPFVSPCVEGRPVRRLGFNAESFSPAYVKPKMALTPCDVTKRMPGERLLGEYSPAQRRDMQISDDFQDMIDIIDNRIEWMASQALSLASITVTGDDYPTATVDFQRNPALATALAGANLWSASATAKPITNLNDWAKLVALNQGGSVTDVIMGSSGFSALSATTEFQNLYKNFQGMGGPLPNILPSVMDNDQKIYHGQIGQFRLWSYNATYTDENDVVQNFIAPNDVILVARQGLQGVQAYGAIQDFASLQATKYFPKMWENQDPSVVFEMVQSAPLIIPRNANATFRATVL